MKKLAVLGPKGTYSDIAALKYISDNNLDLEVEYYPNILRTALALNGDNLAILPFENTLDGFVMESLDLIINSNYHIISQVKLNIDFAFVSNAKNIDDVNKVYCQFKAYGQCIDFISEYKFNIIRTQSNSETKELFDKDDSICGAIIPMHLLENTNYNIVIPHVSDRENNETRFFIVSKNNEEDELKEIIDASIVIVSTKDRPGMLFDILKEFHDANINLKSIMSRPLKTEMGKYKFYIECNLKREELNELKALVNKLNSIYTVNLLGAYNEI